MLNGGCFRWCCRLRWGMSAHAAIIATPPCYLDVTAVQPGWHFESQQQRMIPHCSSKCNSDVLIVGTNHACLFRLLPQSPCERFWSFVFFVQCLSWGKGKSRLANEKKKVVFFNRISKLSIYHDSTSWTGNGLTAAGSQLVENTHLEPVICLFFRCGQWWKTVYFPSSSVAKILSMCN